MFSNWKFSFNLGLRKHFSNSETSLYCKCILCYIVNFMNV